MKKRIFAITIAVLFVTIEIAAQQVEIYSQIGRKNEVSSISYSPDGKYILTTDNDNVTEAGSVKIWLAETGRELKTLYTGYASLSDPIFTGSGTFAVRAHLDGSPYGVFQRISFNNGRATINWNNHSYTN
jgi:WD40 repeat protein